MRSRRSGEMTAVERLVFAGGDVFGGGGAAVLGVLYLIYLTDVVGLSPGLAGVAILVSKVWDAVNDPLMGQLSDRTRTRWGRRRPWLLAGGLLLTPAVALLWLPHPAAGPETATATAAVVVVAYLVYNTVATMIAVPYGSMSTEVTTDVDERNRVNLLRLLFSTVASAGCTLAASALFARYSAGALGVGALYAWLVAGSAGLFAAPIVAVAVVCERTPLPAARTPFGWGSFVAPLRLRAFRSLLILYLGQAVTMDVISTLVMYYSRYVVAGVNATVFLGAFIVVNVGAFVVVNRLVRRVDKHRLYRTLLPLAWVAAIGLGLYPAAGPVSGVYALAVLLAVGLAGALVMSWVMFPDVVDAGELATGERQAGGYSGLMHLIRGLASAVAIQAVALMLHLTGYHSPGAAVPDAGQSPATIAGIRGTLAGSVVVLMSVAWWVARRYPLGRDAVAHQCDQLSHLREGNS